MASNIELNKVYFALPPDFMQKREDKSLLIWSFLPYWMVVDAQMLSLLTLFNGRRTLDEIITHTYIPGSGSQNQFISNVKTLVQKLLSAKILSDKPEKLVVDETYANGLKIEEITIALSDENYNDNVLSTDELKSFLKSTYKYIQKQTILRVIAQKPVQDIEKLIILLKTATFKGLSVILDIPSETYTNELLKELSKLRVQVQVNIDGPYPSLNDAILGEGYFEKSVDIIKKLIPLKIHVILNMNASEHNFQEIESTLKLAYDLKVNECRIVALKKIDKYKNYRSPDYREIINYIVKAVKKNPAYIKLLGRDQFSIYQNIANLNEHKGNCGAGIKQVYLGADGFIYPCKGLRLEQFQVGNAKNPNIEEIWEDSTLLSFLRKELSVQNSPVCARCVIRFWCRAGCKGETIQNTFKAHNASISCKSIQMAFIDLFWLLADNEEITKPKQPYC